MNDTMCDHIDRDLDTRFHREIRSGFGCVCVWDESVALCYSGRISERSMAPPWSARAPQRCWCVRLFRHGTNHWIGSPASSVGTVLSMFGDAVEASAVDSVEIVIDRGPGATTFSGEAVRVAVECE